MKLLTSITILFLTTFSYGQKQGNVWYFGENAGIDFNNGSPVSISDGQTYYNQNNHNEGGTVICNSDGNLLFYSNGEKVWNKNHVVMSNGDSLLGHSSSTQAALIVPKPESDNLFYLFTTDAFIEHNLQYGLRYSVIDMCEDDGNGRLILESKNTLLLDTVAEKITATKHANGKDYWIITHKYWSNTFYAFRLNESGIIDTVVSTIGSVHEDIWLPTNTASAIGQLKISPDGNKIATCFSNTNPAVSELFDFDNLTGVVSNFISLPTDTVGGINLYGVAFSPDNSKLYFSSGEFGLYQYDLTAGGGNVNAIINSRTLVSVPINKIFGMQLAPDGKIYIANLDIPYLSVIDNPNGHGISCNYIDSAVSLDGMLCSYSIPGFIANYDYNNTLVDCTTGINEKYDNKNYKLFPNPASYSTTFEFEDLKQGPHSLILYNLQGQAVKEINYTRTAKLKIGLKDLSNGMYYFQLHSEGNILSSGKLIKE